MWQRLIQSQGISADTLSHRAQLTAVISFKPLQSHWTSAVIGWDMPRAVLHLSIITTVTCTGQKRHPTGLHIATPPAKHQTAVSLILVNPKLYWASHITPRSWSAQPTQLQLKEMDFLIKGLCGWFALTAEEDTKCWCFNPELDVLVLVIHTRAIIIIYLT